MSPDSPPNSTCQIQRMRLQLAVLSEIVEELSKLMDRSIHLPGRCEPIPVRELLRHCRSQREAVRRHLVKAS